MVLNMSYREGAYQAVLEIKIILTFSITHAEDEWIPDVVKTVANKGKGLEDVVAEIDRHKEHQKKTGLFLTKRSQNERDRVVELVESLLRVDFWTNERRDKLAAFVTNITERQMTSYDAAAKLVEDFKR